MLFVVLQRRFFDLRFFFNEKQRDIKAKALKTL